MRLPDILLVGDEVWTVRRKMTLDNLGRDIVGYCDPSTNEILIKAGQSKEDELATLVHEYIHAIEYSRDIEIPHKLVYKLERDLASLIYQLLT